MNLGKARSVRLPRSGLSDLSDLPDLPDLSGAVRPGPALPSPDRSAKRSLAGLAAPACSLMKAGRTADTLGGSSPPTVNGAPRHEADI